MPGEPSVTRWPLTGSADAEDGEELHLRSRRIVRRWDSNLKVFTESLSDGTRRTIVIATKKRFEGSLKAGVPGRHGVTLSSETKELCSEKLALGLIGALFSKAPDDVKTILEITAKGLSFLDEIEQILLRKSGNSDKERHAFLLRVGAEV